MSHPALDAFGDLDAAAHDPHVAGCPRCQADLRTQLQVRDLLAALPDPGPTPPDVVDRIEATLRRLSAEQHAPEAVSGAGSTVVPLAPARERRQHRGWFAAAAAVVLLGAGGAVVSQLVPDPGGASDSTAAGAALRESPRKQAESDAAGLRATASGTDYTADRLPAQVDRVLAGQRAASVAPPAGPLATPAGVAACLAAIGAPQATPLLVDVARYQGSPAAVVVLPAAGGGHEIWVVSTTCSPGKDGTRYFTRTR